MRDGKAKIFTVIFRENQLVINKFISILLNNVNGGIIFYTLRKNQTAEDIFFILSFSEWPKYPPLVAARLYITYRTPCIYFKSCQRVLTSYHQP